MYTSSPKGLAVAFGQPSKRRRTPVACIKCRIRKSRCDGNRPRCSTCVDTGAECLYQQKLRNEYRATDLGESVLLHNRLHALEEKLLSLPKSDIHPANSKIQEIQRLYRNLMPEEQMNVQNSEVVDILDRAPWLDSGYDSQSDDREDTVDGMAVVASLDDDAEDFASYGPSSNIFFLRKLSLALAYATKDSSLPKPSAYMANWPRTATSPVLFPTANHNGRCDRIHRMTGVLELPAESTSTLLLHEYFSGAGLILPYVHEDTFLNTYNKARKDMDKKVKKSWLGLLNIILAIASTTSHRASPDHSKSTEGDRYYRRAKRLSKDLGEQHHGLESVQLFLLTSCYLQGTQRSTQTWVTHALAVNAALRIGLYTSETSKKLPLLEREMRKRVWYGCVNNDRILSMSFGRPALIPQSYVRIDLPVNINDEFPAAQRSSILIATSIAHFNASITLSEIMGNAVDQLYDQNLSSTQLSIVESTQRNLLVCCKLQEWKANLPLSLSILESTGVWETFAPDYIRFKLHLTLRYHGLHILIHRTLLAKLFDNDAQQGFGDYELALLQETGSSLLAHCMSACTELIFLVDRVVKASDSDVNVYGAWWISSYYVYTSSLVILGILITCRDSRWSSLLPATAITDLEDALNNALEVMEGLNRGSGNTMLEKCHGSLSKMLETYRNIEPSKGTLTQSDFSSVEVEKFLQFPNIQFSPQLTAECMNASFGIGRVFGDDFNCSEMQQSDSMRQKPIE